MLSGLGGGPFSETVAIAGPPFRSEAESSRPNSRNSILIESRPPFRLRSLPLNSTPTGRRRSRFSRSANTQSSGEFRSQTRFQKCRNRKMQRIDLRLGPRSLTASEGIASAVIECDSGGLSIYFAKLARHRTFSP